MTFVYFEDLYQGKIMSKDIVGNNTMLPNFGDNNTMITIFGHNKIEFYNEDNKEIRLTILDDDNDDFYGFSLFEIIYLSAVYVSVIILDISCCFTFFIPDLKVNHF